MGSLDQVFSCANRPLLESIAAGDCDGDLYFVCWDSQILDSIKPHDAGKYDLNVMITSAPPWEARRRHSAAAALARGARHGQRDAIMFGDAGGTGLVQGLVRKMRSVRDTRPSLNSGKCT